MLSFDLRGAFRSLRRDRITAVAVVVGGVALLSALTAARQGLRLDPAAALRDE